MSLQKHDFFPTTISASLKKELALKMLPVAKRCLADTSYDASELDYKQIYVAGPGIDHNKDLDPFIDFIMQASAEHLESIQYDSSKIKLNVQLYIGIMQENDTHNFHTHPGSILSGLMYLQVPEGSSPIIFRDPRPFRSIINLPSKQHTGSVYFQPVDGLFLIWESWLGHEVPKTSNKESRITMVFNLGV